MLLAPSDFSSAATRSVSAASCSPSATRRRSSLTGEGFGRGSGRLDDSAAGDAVEVVDGESWPAGASAACVAVERVARFAGAFLAPDAFLTAGFFVPAALPVPVPLPVPLPCAAR